MHKVQNVDVNPEINKKNLNQYINNYLGVVTDMGLCVDFHITKAVKIVNIVQTTRNLVQ